MKNRIKELLSNRKTGILSMYYTAGFPNLADTATDSRIVGSGWRRYY